MPVMTRVTSSHHAKMRQVGSVVLVIFVVLSGLCVMRFRETQNVPRAFVAVADVEEEQKQQEPMGFVGRTSMDLDLDDPVRFLFFAGVEGTGHHLMNTLIKKSPHHKTISKKWGLDDASRLVQASVSHNLWSAHCEGTDQEDVQAKYKEFVKQLQEAQRAVKKKLDKSSVSEMTIYLNAERHMNSYPYRLRSCRVLMNPDLHTLYRACADAGVQCRHVYLYRDPYEIVRSTTIKRDFNPNILSAAKLYMTTYQVIESQMRAYPEKLVGCWGFFEPDNSKSVRWDDLIRILGWQDNLPGWEKLREEKIFTPMPLSEENRTQLVPSRLSPYMKSLVISHEIVLDLCLQQAQANGVPGDASS